jgi:Ulp1 family protease
MQSYGPHEALIPVRLCPTGEPAVSAGPCPQQDNGYDCGMYVLLVARFLAKSFAIKGVVDAAGMAEHINPDLVTEQRRRIQKLIEGLIEAAGGQA